MFWASLALLSLVVVWLLVLARRVLRSSDGSRWKSVLTLLVLLGLAAPAIASAHIAVEVVIVGSLLALSWVLWPREHAT